MIKLDIESIILNIFKEDKMRNKENTVYSQLAMITIKSLIPSGEFIGNTIDYKRFGEEVKLLKCYNLDREGCFDANISKDLYFKYKDRTIYSRVLPIIVANNEYSIIEEEVIKNIIYTTGHVEILLEWLAISKTIFMILEGEEDVRESLKQYVINISQKDFLDKYKEKYRYDYAEEGFNFEVEFERARVFMISLLHDVDMVKFKALKDLLGLLNDKEGQTPIGKILEADKGRDDLLVDLDKTYENMASYILKLRKSRIDPNDLKIKEYILPDVFSFKEGEMFFHSLLNKAQVIKKEVKDDSLTSLVQTRAGMYLFKRDPFN